jgi:hypothetical protein
VHARRATSQCAPVLAFHQPEKHRQGFERVDDRQQGREGADEQGRNRIHRLSVTISAVVADASAEK